MRWSLTVLALAGLLTSAAAAQGATGPVSANAASLHLLTWESYISPVLLERWKARTHTDINQVYFDSGDARDAMLSNAGGTVDLVMISQARVQALGARGILDPLSAHDVPNLALIAPEWRTACQPYGAPYMWGTTGILYRADKLTSPPTSWKDLLQPAPELSRHIAMVTDDDDALTAPLSFLGKARDSNNIEDLKQAFNLLRAQAPAVLTYGYVITAEAIPAFHDKIYMALGFTGDQVTLNRSRAGINPWHFVTPREGSVVWVDCMAVVASSAAKPLALKFIDFLNEPENAAENARYLRLPSPNQAALALLPPSMRTDPEIYPPDEILARSQPRVPIARETLQLRRRMVSALVSLNDAQ